VRRRAAALLASLCGCYAPSLPSSVPCDPAAPACPEGQVCAPVAGGFACMQPGGPDSGPHDGPPDALGALDHVRTGAGWKARVFHDFSARFTYVMNDFVDGPETYDNQPDALFVLRPPFAEALAVVAGRVVIELTATIYTPHDYGAHAPNTAGLPDHLRDGTFVPDLDGGGPAVLLTSSSANGGDGSFRVTPAWAVSTDRTANNVRSILWDATGQFDALGAPEGYLGTMAGVLRRSAVMGTAIVPGDAKTMRLVGGSLVVTRQLATSTQLIEVASGSHVEKVLAERGVIELVEGPAPAPHRAWAIFDRSQLVLIRDDGTFQTVAESLDPDFDWEAGAVPAAPHALAGATPIVYLIESNRARDVDRVIAVEAEP
jgi:hypothetical protein